MNKKKVVLKESTIYDIAKIANTTAPTVSRALNDHPRISPVTKAKILKIALSLDYRPNKFASSLRTGSGKTIGVVVPQINWHFFSNLISGIEERLNKDGYSLIICQSNENVKRETKCLETLVNNRVDGILISVSNETVNDNNLKIC